MRLIIIVSIGILLVLLLGAVFIGGGSSIRCKGQEGSVLFSYDSFFSTVDIGGEPTYHSGEPWVDFMDVEDEGFVIVFSQKGYDSKIKGIRTIKNVYRYRLGEGFAFWHDVPHQDVAFVKSLDDLPAQKTSNIFADCNNQFGGEFIQTLEVVNRV